MSGKWQPTPVFLPGKSHGWKSLVGCSPWGRKESDTTEWLHFHFSLSCIGEGNGNPLQYSCLENPMIRGNWRATVYGVTKGRTQLSTHTITHFHYLPLSVFDSFMLFHDVSGPEFMQSSLSTNFKATSFPASLWRLQHISLPILQHTRPCSESTWRFPNTIVSFIPHSCQHLHRLLFSIILQTSGWEIPSSFL